MTAFHLVVILSQRIQLYYPMKLKIIDKKRYRKHLNRVFLGMAIGALTTSIPLSTLLIFLFSEPGGANFIYNFLGAVMSLALIIFILIKIKHHPYMLEVAYIWDLKQQLNRIYRAQKAIDKAADEGNKEALIILNFQCRGSIQLYELDDNLITIDDLTLELAGNDALLDQLGITTGSDLFEPSLLKQFR